MLKKIVLVLLFIYIPFSNINAENLNNSFLMDFTLKPDFNKGIIYRGVSVQWNINLLENWHFGLGLRLIHEDYPSFYALTGSGFNLSSRLYIPLEAGFGAEIENLELLENENQNGINTFVLGKSGIEWQVDNFWSYYVHLTYNYKLNTELTNFFYTSIGVKYLY